MGDTRLPFFAALLGALEEIPTVRSVKDDDPDGVDALSVESNFLAMPLETRAQCEPAWRAFSELVKRQAELHVAAQQLSDQLSPLVQPLVIEALYCKLRQLPVPVLCSIAAADQSTIGGELSGLAEATCSKQYQ